MNPIAYSYNRFSTKEQAEGTSEQRQDDAAARICRQEDWHLDRKLIDPGTSGYRGKHRRKGHLKAFLDLIKARVVKPGSWLIVEEINRLTREHPLDGLDLVKAIVHAEVGICVVHPFNKFTKQNIGELTNFLGLVLEIVRGHESSREKERWGRDYWRIHRQAIGKELYSPALPAWLEEKNGKPVVNSEKAATVRKILQMVLDGLGAGLICRKLNAEKVPHIAKGWNKRTGKKWQPSYVHLITRNQAIIGTLQPCECKYDEQGNYKRIPIGKAVPDYFPVPFDGAVAMFRKVQRVLDSRKGTRGRISDRVTNLFSGLTYCNGTKFTVNYKGTMKDGSHYIYLSAPKEEEQVGIIPYPPVENALLIWIKDIQLVQADENAMAELEVRKKELQHKITGLKERMKMRSDIEEYYDLLEEAKDELKAIQTELEETNATEANQAIIQSKQLVKLLEGCEDDIERNDIRLRLRQVVANVIRRIDLHSEGRNWKRISIKVKLRSGDTKDIFLLTYRGRYVISTADADKAKLPCGKLTPAIIFEHLKVIAKVYGFVP